MHVDGESDDDFEFIDIKEKIKAFVKENGKNQRIPDNLINEAVRWRLNRNDCQNRGYVLDGYPKTLQQAQDVFIITPQRPVRQKKLNEDGEEVEEEPPEEEEDPNKYKPTLQKNIYPESVIFLRASQLFLKRRAKQFLQEKAQDKGKWHISIMPGKINKFNENNSMDLFREENEKFPTTKFYQDNKTELFEVDAEGEAFEMFESMRIYIERFGRPYNYLKSIR